MGFFFILEEDLPNLTLNSNSNKKHGFMQEFVLISPVSL
jgi:hypothetical protein